MNYLYSNLIFVLSLGYQCNVLTVTNQGETELTSGEITLGELGHDTMDLAQAELDHASESIPMDIDLSRVLDEHKDLKPQLGFLPATLDLDPRGKIQEPRG